MDFKKLEDDFLKEVENAFLLAQKKDEFEFVMLLLGYKGAMGDPRALSHIYESEQIFKEFSKIVASHSGDFIGIRINLFLYCHFFEMNELYKIIGNVLYIINGDGYKIDLFSNDWTDSQELYPIDKIKKLRELTATSGMYELINHFERLYFNRLRNSFFHSDYSIVEGDYILVSRKPIDIDGVLCTSLSIKDFILPLTQSVIRIAQHFFDLLNKFKFSYRNNKLIRGRFPHWQPIVVLGHPEKGLIGFENIYGGSIKLMEMAGQPFLAAYNIVVNNPHKPSILEKRLIEIVQKNNYGKAGSELLNLESDIVGANDLKLLKELSIPFYNWGNNIIKIADAEVNTRKRNSLIGVAIKKYDLALRHDPEMAVCIYNRTLSYLKLQKAEVKIEFDEAYLGSELERAINLRPEMTEPYEAAADVFYGLGTNAADKRVSLQYYLKALIFFEEACKHDTSDGRLHYNAGLTCYHLISLDLDNSLNYFRKSKLFFDISISVDPYKIEYYLGYASSFEATANEIRSERIALLGEANTILQKAIAINPDIPRTFFKIGINKFLLSNELSDQKEQLLIDSVKAFKQSKELNPLNDQYLNNLGLAQYHLAVFYDNEYTISMLNEAISNLNEALKIKPDKKESFFNLGICHLMLYKRQGNPIDGELTVFNLQSAENLGEEISFYLMTYYSIVRNKTAALHYFEIYKHTPEFNLETILEEDALSFVREMPELEGVLNNTSSSN